VDTARYRYATATIAAKAKSAEIAPSTAAGSLPGPVGSNHGANAKLPTPKTKYAARRTVHRGTNRPSGKTNGSTKNPEIATAVVSRVIACAIGWPGSMSSMEGGYCALTFARKMNAR
jgi:hypothetical protein